MVTKNTPRVSRSIFIGSSKEAEKGANYLQLALADTYAHKVEVWSDAFTITEETMTTLERTLGDFDYAVFIISPDDVAEIRGESVSVVRDNVIFEAGLFIGRIGLRNVFLVHSNAEKFHLPSDLLSVKRIVYPLQHNRRAEMRMVATQIDDVIQLSPSKSKKKDSIEGKKTLESLLRRMSSSQVSEAELGALFTADMIGSKLYSELCSKLDE